MLKLKGKLLDAVNNFVFVLPIPEWYMFGSLAEYEILVTKLASLRPKFLDENEAGNIVQEVLVNFVINEKVNDRTNYTLEETQALKEVLSTAFKAYIESLPRQYLFRFEIPNFPSWGEFGIDISPRVKLISEFSDQDFSHSNPAKSVSLASLLNPKTELKTCLLIKTKGYASSSPNSQTTAEVISIAKQCVFLLTTFGIMNTSYHKGARAELVTLKPAHSQSVQLPESVSKSFGLLPNETKLLTDDSPQLSLLGGPRRPAKTNEEKIKALSENFGPLRNYFQRANHPDYQSISAAIEWYQDSTFSDNQTFSYLAACIGLEALLGTEDFMDMMSKRLTDRFATLMGKGRTARNKLVKEYTEVLKLRGEIVHAKEARLTARHQQALFKVQKMLLDVIWNELHQLYREDAA